MSSTSCPYCQYIIPANPKVLMYSHLTLILCSLSYEINKTQIDDLIREYQKQNDGLPNLEMIVYGKAHLLFTKYCPLKKLIKKKINKRLTVFLIILIIASTNSVAIT